MFSSAFEFDSNASFSTVPVTLFSSCVRFLEVAAVGYLADGVPSDRDTAMTRYEIVFYEIDCVETNRLVQKSCKSKLYPCDFSAGEVF